MEIKYLKDVAIRYDQDENPVLGDRIEIEILGQIFRKDIHLDIIEERFNGSIDIVKAGMIGEALEEIGRTIQMQAHWGQSLRIVHPNAIEKSF